MGKNHRRKRQHKKKKDEPYPESSYVRRGVAHTRKPNKEERELKKYGRLRDL